MYNSFKKILIASSENRAEEAWIGYATSKHIGIVRKNGV